MVCAGRGAGFFFATAFLTDGVFLRVSGFLAGAFCRLDLVFFLVAICELQAFRSVIRMIATTFPSLNACSFVPLLQVQTKFFFAVKVFPSCSSRISPSVIWQSMAFSIGALIVVDTGCIM